MKRSIFLVAVFACGPSGSATEPAPPIDNQAAAAAPTRLAPTIPPGPYACGWRDGDQFSCIVSAADDGQQSLHKQNGTYRLLGTIAATDAGFVFNGHHAATYIVEGAPFFKALEVVFKRTGANKYKTSIAKGWDLTLELREGEFGGQTYGGMWSRPAYDKEIKLFEEQDEPGEQ